MSAGSEPRFVVVCDDWTAGPCRTRESAERLLAQIEQAGHCRLPHRVEAVEPS